MINILWMCLELAASFLETLFCIHFIIKSFNGKVKVIGLRATYAVGLLGMTATVTIMNHITIYEGLLGFIYVVLFFTFSVVFLHGAFWKKLFISIITVVCLISTSAITGNVLLAIFKEEPIDIYTKPGLERFIFLAIGVALNAYVFAFVQRFTNKGGYFLKPKEWRLILSVLCVSFLMIALIQIVMFDIDYKQSPPYLLMFVELGIIIINVLCLNVTTNLNETHKREEELIIEKKKIEYDQKYVQDVREQYEQTRRLRHDMKQYAVTMLSLVQSNKLDAVEELAQKLAAETTKSETVIRVDNDILNAILNTKLSYAGSLGIDVFCSVGNGVTGIEDMDLCNLLGNLLDNAITAAKVCDNKQRLIEVVISTSGNRLIITVKNSIQASVLNVNAKLKSTKPDPGEHGLGIKTIKAIADKYDGNVDFYEENLMFLCRVILYKRSKND